MAGKLQLNWKELREILRVFNYFNLFSSRSQGLIVSIVKDDDDGVRIGLSNEQVFIHSVVNDPIILTDIEHSYTFDATLLYGLKLDDTSQITLGWDNANSPLTIDCGAYHAALNVAVPYPIDVSTPASIDHVQVPYTHLNAIGKYLNIPYSYYAGKRDLTPICFKASKETITAQADDKFSFARVSTTNLGQAKDFEIIFPKYILTAMFGSKDKSKLSHIAKIGAKNYSAYIEDHSLAAFFAGLNDEVIPFNNILQRYHNKWFSSFDFSPKEFVIQIKPILSILDKKDKIGSIINMSIFNDHISLSLNHSTMGSATIDNIAGVHNICNEQGFKNVNIHLHPKAFEDYTGLLKDVESVKCMVHKDVVYYYGTEAIGDDQIIIEYLYPTVQV